ncbi:GNAT family N-acetyltransferase [Pseudomonas trivialis]|uniref:GNAT family N-acetyltransferase n=2 Tax=Pseudomonas trivialis TaxID=200450 RepID=UPI003BB10DCB
MRFSDIPAALLRSPHLQLAAPTIDKAEQMHRLIQDFTQPHTDFLVWAKGRNSLEDARANLQTAVDNFNADQNEYKFLIIDNSCDALVGCISLFIRDLRIPHLEIGYWIGTDSMGKGYASEACALPMPERSPGLRPCSRIIERNTSTPLATGIGRCS